MAMGTHSNNTSLVTDRAIVVGANGYAVNYGHLNISKPEEPNYFEYEHPAHSHPGQFVKNIAICGMAALEDHPNKPGQKVFASHATLINRGVIDMHFDEIYAFYKKRKIEMGGDPNSTDTDLDTVRCYAMAAGTDSMLINEGVINVYMDQEIDARVSHYGCALWANARSFMLNRGKINFLGNGSWQSYLRGIGSMDSYLQVINEGVVTVDVPRAYQTRILHTAGQYGSLTNNGKIYVKTGGRIMVLGSLAGTRMTNNGLIEVTSLSTYLKNVVPYHYQFDPLATGFYEHFAPNDLPTCPMVNRGDIKVHLYGTEASGPNAVAFGFYCHQMGQYGKTSVHSMENEGNIEITQEGPCHYNTAEVGVNVQAVGDVPVFVKIGNWKTTARDFGKLHDLFISRSARFDLSHLKLNLVGGDGHDKALLENLSQLVYQLPDSKEAHETCELKTNSGDYKPIM